MNNALKHIDTNLIKKYDVYAFDYIEYPHKSFWSYEFSDNDKRTALKSLFSDEKDSPLLLYIHLPFCEQRCYFCICHTEVTKNYERVKNYLNNALYPEIDLHCEFFGKNSITPNFQEIYFGGGSPTILQEKEFDRLIEKIRSIADMKNIKQFTIEIDPRRVTKERLKYYHSKGVNKISIGVQDIDPKVQKTINRIQPPQSVESLLTPDIRKCFNSINFDILCGLPGQSIESIRKTMEWVTRISPDRISFTFMHYLPKFAPHQKLMLRNASIPDSYESKMFFAESIQSIMNCGYLRTGFEHFAKPTDDVAKALKEKMARYSSLGVTEGRCINVIAVGRHSYSTIGDYYFQNVYEQIDYETVVKNGKFPIYRGYKLNSDDVIRRDIIQALRTYFSLNCRNIEKKYNINFKKYFNEEISELSKFAEDNLLNISDDAINITELGKYFTIQICRVFDKFIRTIK